MGELSPELIAALRPLMEKEGECVLCVKNKPTHAILLGAEGSREGINFFCAEHLANVQSPTRVIPEPLKAASREEIMAGVECGAPDCREQAVALGRFPGRPESLYGKCYTHRNPSDRVVLGDT